MLYGRLRLTAHRMALSGQRLVVVDDVMASGAHLRAAAAFLRDCGAEVLCAICAARACDTLTPNRSPLVRSVDVLRDFQSDPDGLLPETIDGVEL